MTAASSFTRDSLTWLAYLMTGFFVMTQAALGPSMPFLREELNLSYTQGGLHLTLFATGSVIAGLTVDRLTALVGRRVLFWGGSAMMAGGAFLLTLGNALSATLPAVVTMGFGGSTVLITIQSILTDYYPDYRATALTEANAIGSAGGILAPLLIGGLQALMFGWRVGIYTMVGLWVLIVLFGWRQPIPRSDEATDFDGADPTARLSPVLNLTFVLVFFGAAAEWVTIAWSADFMTEALNLEAAIASSMLLAFFIANAGGRWAISRLTTVHPLPHLLFAMMATGAAGFLVFWLVRVPVVSIAGLFVAGVGIANFFPLALALIMDDAPGGQIDKISTRTSLAAGAAILLAPQVTGILADQVGILTAFGIVPLIIVVMTGLLIARRRLVTA